MVELCRLDDGFSVHQPPYPVLTAVFFTQKVRSALLFFFNGIFGEKMFVAQPVRPSGVQLPRPVLPTFGMVLLESTALTLRHDLNLRILVRLRSGRLYAKGLRQFIKRARLMT